jgi:hypothetical protein
MAAQLELALDNLEAVLAAGEMTLANIARLNTAAGDRDVGAGDDSSSWELSRPVRAGE